MWEPQGERNKEGAVGIVATEWASSTSTHKRISFFCTRRAYPFHREISLSSLVCHCMSHTIICLDFFSSPHSVDTQKVGLVHYGVRKGRQRKDKESSKTFAAYGRVMLEQSLCGLRE